MVDFMMVNDTKRALKVKRSARKKEGKVKAADHNIEAEKQAIKLDKRKHFDTKESLRGHKRGWK